MKYVFVLTETGAGYDEKGIEYVTGKLKKDFGETDKLVFMMGDELNDPKNLIALLEDHVSDGYVVISRDDGIMYMDPGEGITGMAGILKEHPGENSWRTLVNVIDDTIKKRTETDPDFKIREI